MRSNDALSDNDAIPFAAGDFSGEHLAALLGQVFLGGNQQLRIGVKLHELTGELFEQVIGDDVHRLLN